MGKVLDSDRFQVLQRVLGVPVCDQVIKWTLLCFADRAESAGREALPAEEMIKARRWRLGQRRVDPGSPVAVRVASPPHVLRLLTRNHPHTFEKITLIYREHR